MDLTRGRSGRLKRLCRGGYSKSGTPVVARALLERFEIINFQYGKEENLEGLLSHGNDVFNLELEADAEVLMLGFLPKGVFLG
ncbi:unnamed protein product [Natator depressus]